MASKSGQQEPEKAEVIEDLLDGLDTALDRVKVLYEQYFLGIQKQPPAYLHTDAERKIRDLTQIQIRNTALRYRFATLQQKYGSYNSYWRRTLRQIENGTYTRNLHKVGRQAARTGAAVPEEILAAMPKRMRDQVLRDREAALALARLREREAKDDELLTLADEDVDIDVEDLDAAFIHEPSAVRRNALTAAGAHRIDEADAEFDVDAFFASVTQDDAPSRDTLSRAAVEPPADPPARTGRSGRPTSRPPLAGARGALAARNRRPSTKRPPIDEGPPSFAESTGMAARKTTGAIRAVRPPSSPGIEPAPRSPTGRLPTVRPPSNDDTEPGLPIPPTVAASPVAATRKITGPMRTVRPPSTPDPEPASAPAAAPDRAAGQAATARPPASHDSARRLSIPPIGAASPAAATRRIIPPARAARPPSSSDAEPAAPSSAPPARATGETRAVLPPAGADAGSAAIQPAVRDASAFAAESTQRARPAAIIPPVPAAGTRTPPVGQAVVPPPAVRPDPARLAPSQATKPLRVAPGSAAAHAATPVETLDGPFPRIPGPPPSLAPSRPAAAPPEPPPIPPPLPLGDRAAAPPPRRPASEPASAATSSPAPPPAGSPPAAPSGDPAAVPAGDAAPPAARRPPPARPATTPSVPKRPDAARPERPPERPPPEPRQAPPPGMTDADVNALYAKYVKAKQILGEETEPGTYGKLLKTIHAQAPKIMEQYKAKGVDFSVVVKDNQVIIRAKPKT